MQLKKENTVGIAFVLASITALTPLAIDMYLPAFPAIAAGLGAREEAVQLSLTSFFIGLAIGQLVYGTLADRFGRKIPLFGGLLLASVASLLCATAESIDTLIAMRFLQAFGVCAGAVIARAVVRDLFNAREGARFFSLLMAIMGVAPILAPLAGAYVAGTLGWPWIFNLIAGFGFFALAISSVFLPETHGPNPGVLFTRAFHTYADVLKNRSFLKYAMAGGAANGGMFAYITGSSLVIQNHFGMSPDFFALAFGFNAFGLIGLTQLNRVLLARYELSQILSMGLVLILLASAGLMAVAIADGPLWLFLVPLFFYIASLGILMPNNMAAAMESEGARAGSASALSGSLNFTIAFAASAVIGQFEASSAVPLATVMTVLAVISFIFTKLPETKSNP